LINRLKTKIMKNIITLIAVLFFSVPAFSQIELALKGGGSFYFGDISSDNGRSIHNAKETVGLHVRYNYHPMLSFQLGYNWLKVVGTDAYSARTMGRNLKVSTYINEVYLMPEFNFLNIKIGESGKFTSYISTGISYFDFMPTTYYGRSGYIRLQELGTEGQGLPGYAEPYKTKAFAIPMSWGVKLIITEVLSVDWTLINNRYTFTDYLDDVSTVYPDFELLEASKGKLAVALSNRSENDNLEGQKRGTPETNDWYGSMTLAFCFNLGAMDAKKKPRRNP
jgi:hypothetical protein